MIFAGSAAAFGYLSLRPSIDVLSDWRKGPMGRTHRPVVLPIHRQTEATVPSLMAASIDGTVVGSVGEDVYVIADFARDTGSDFSPGSAERRGEGDRVVSI